MKTIERLIKQPAYTTVVTTSALATLLLAFTLFSGFSQQDQSSDSVNALPINFIITVFSLALTFLPSLFFRLYCYSLAWDYTDKKKLVASGVSIIESLVLFFSLNVYMEGITGGYGGTAGIVILSFFSVVALVFWVIVAIVGYFTTRKMRVYPKF